MADGGARLKDPHATLDYGVDWSAWLGADTIESVAWSVPAGLTKTAESNTDTVAYVWLSGGTAGTTYQVVCRVTTTGGRTDDRTLELICKER